MFNLCCLVVTAAVYLTIGVESRPEYFVGGEMKFSCPEFPRMNIQEAVFVITMLREDHPPMEILAYGNGSVTSVQDQIINVRYRNRVVFDPPVLRLRDLEIRDKGLYRCITKYERGLSAEVEVNIDVKARPSKIYTAESTTTVAENGNYTATTCVAEGARPPARIRWVEADTKADCDFFETHEVESKYADLTTTTKAVLRLPPEEIEGSTKPALRQKAYTCVVTHLGVIVKEKTVDVKLLYVPGPVTISIHSDRPKQFDEVSLKCRSTCVPKCTYNWFLNGEFLSPGSKLYLTNVTEKEAGNSSYRCTAENIIGSASGDIRLSQDSAVFHSKSQEADVADNQIESIVLYVVVGAVVFIACSVLIVLLVKKHNRTQKLTYVINGSESTESRADSNDDVYGSVSNRTSRPSVSPDQSNAPSTVEETLSEPTNSPTPEQDVDDFIVDVPTLSETFHRTFRDALSSTYGHSTVDRRFSSLSSRNRPLPLSEPTRFSTLPRNSTRYPMPGPCNNSRDYYSRSQSADPTRRYMLPPSIPENGPYQMTEAEPWMPRTVGSILSVRPSHPDDATMDGLLTVATEV